jgi:NAD(P)-dependent dehydrogenase (short-subunit alcohol dehydrogenase family)
MIRCLSFLREQSRRTPVANTSNPDRVALVAGASRGIGAETALAFARSGYAVVLGARSGDALAAVVDAIEAGGGRAVAATTDVGDVDSMRSLVDLAVGSFGRLDAAFNNATDGPPPGPLADIDPGMFDLGIRTNVRGTFLGMKFEIPAMLAGGGGAIVNMASVAGVRAMTNLAAYVAGKAGIIALTETAALDYADRGIRVNVVAPGPILTHHLERAGAEAQRLAGGVSSDAAGRHGQGRRRRGAVALLRAVAVHHGGHAADRRRPARRPQAVPDVPPGRGDEGHLNHPSVRRARQTKEGLRDHHQHR